MSATCPDHPGAQLRRGWRTIIGVLLASTLLLSGCSVLRLAYDQAPNLVYWRLDGDLRLDDTQAPLARQAIDEWFEWHRRTELPAYAEFLRTVRAHLSDELHGDLTCQWWGEAREALERALRATPPGLARLAVTLRPEQVQRLALRQQERLDEWRSEVEADDAEQRRTRRALGRAERLYGRLDATQREELARVLRDTPWDDAHWLALRQERDDRFVHALHKASTLDKDRAADLLGRTMKALFDVPGPATQRTALQQRRGCETAAAVHNLTTPTQRVAAQARLQGWEEDLRRLAAR